MRFSEIGTESDRICLQCGMKGCTCKPGYPKKVDESVIHGDSIPKLSGLSFNQIDSLVESCGADYSKFGALLNKKLNLPEWANTLELFGIYVRQLDNMNSLTEGKFSPIEKKLFKNFSERTKSNINDAVVGDSVSLLNLVTLTIPNHKVEARLRGFLNPKEIVEIVDDAGFKQLKFSDGTMYPNKDEGDIFQTVQTWNMTKLFSSYDSAEKAYLLYALEGNLKSDSLNFMISVDTKKDQIG